MASSIQTDKFRKMLWPKIDDASTAMAAMKLAQWVGLLIAIGYGLALAITISIDQYPDGTSTGDEAELYGMVFFFIVLAGLALLLWFLARRGNGWATLILSVWGVVEAGLKLITLPGQGVILAILMIIFCVGGFRGWLGIRKYGRPSEADGRTER
jgi:hypothetical protein